MERKKSLSLRVFLDPVNFCSAKNKGANQDSTITTVNNPNIFFFPGERVRFGCSDVPWFGVCLIHQLVFFALFGMSHSLGQNLPPPVRGSDPVSGIVTKSTFHRLSQFSHSIGKSVQMSLLNLSSVQGTVARKGILMCIVNHRTASTRNNRC